MKLRFATDEELRDYEDRGPEYEAAPERDEVVLYKGTGKPAEEVELKPTNIKPYMMFPGLAKAEQEVTLARYGGVPIQVPREGDESAVEQRAPGQQPARPGPGEPGPPPYRGGGAELPGGFRIERPEDILSPQARLAFEQTVFRQIGGNPYMIDAQKEIDRATAEDMPKLFEKIFRGQAIWADRDRLSPEQKKVWLEELKRYRAFIKDRVESEKRAKIDSYKWMMSRFDDFQKMAEADLKRQREQRRETRTEQKDEAARLSRVQQDERMILKRMSEIVTKAAEAGTPELAGAVAEEYKQLGEQLAATRREKEALLMKRDPVYREKKQKEFYQRVAPDEMAAAHERWTPPEPPGPGQVRKKLPSPDEAQPEETGAGEASIQPQAEAFVEAPTEAPAESPQRKKFRVELPKLIEMGGFKFKRPQAGAPVEVRYHKASGRLLGKFADGHVEVLERVE